MEIIAFIFGSIIFIGIIYGGIMAIKEYYDEWKKRGKFHGPEDYISEGRNSEVWNTMGGGMATDKSVALLFFGLLLVAIFAAIGSC